LCLKQHCLNYNIDNTKCCVQFASHHFQMTIAQIQDRFDQLCLTDRADEGELPPHGQHPAPMQQHKWPQQHQQQPAQQQQQWPEQHQQQPAHQQQQWPQQQQQQGQQPGVATIPVAPLFYQQPLAPGLMTQAHQPQVVEQPANTLPNSQVIASSPMSMSSCTVTSSWTGVSLDERMMTMQ